MEYPPTNTTEQLKTSETAPLSGRPRRQYHYFYGSTADANNDSLTVATNDTNSLIGEALVATDNEEETPNNSESDLRRMSRAKKNPGLPWLGVQGAGAGNGLGRVLLILLVVAVISTFVILLMPHSSRPIPETQNIVVPYAKVSRSDYGDPVEGFVNVELFHPSLVSNDDLRTFNFPFPTGAFWTNLVVPSPDSVYTYPIVVYPYAYKWSKDSLQLSYPAARRLEDKHHRWIIDNFAPDLTISTVETAESRFVTKFDSLSVTLRYVASPENKWETTLVQGSPYTTMKYMKATPTFKALSTFKSVQCPGDEAEDFHDFMDIDGNDDDTGDRRRLFGVCSMEDNGSSTTMRGVQFMFTSKEGAYWILFSSEPIVLHYDNIRKTTIEAAAPFTGVLRLAYIPAEEASDTSTFSSTGLRRLIYHAGVYPTGAQVSWDFPKSTQASRTGGKSSGNATASSRHAVVQFTFEVATMTEDSHRPASNAIKLLMLALPHHVQILPKALQLRHDKRFDLIYSCIKGPMTPIVGSVWTFEEALYDLDFDVPPRDLDPGVRQAILDQVADDIDRVLPTKDENVYGFGKQAARLAQLMHITYELGDKDAPGYEDPDSILAKGKGLLFDFLKSFLTSDVVDYLVFDNQMGGIVSQNGLLDKSEDFGNGRYNDHHFHYGYILYACAIMARLDPSFVEIYGVYVDAIFHDIAHSANGDSKTVPRDNAFFPLSRHKSWFDGHSFATGMFSFGNGKSQESSSEAVNCYYGAYLWSLVRHGNGSVESDLTDFARLLFAMEVRGAQTYWHMLPQEALGNYSKPSPVYSATFKENFMVGNVGMLDVAVNTWFGNDALYVHMINAIPITAATAVLFNENYVKHEYPYLMKSRSEVEMAWRGYTVSIHAITDPNKAWEEADSIVSYELDAAISKSQVLYWITTRPGFNVTLDLPPESEMKKNDPTAACSAHDTCADAGITGQCCPTPDGTFLGCCGTTSSKVPSSTGTSKTSPQTTDDDAENDDENNTRSCNEHPDCIDLGLGGLCCPTSDGIMLGCCS